MFSADADQLIKYIFPLERLPAHTQVRDRSTPLSLQTLPAPNTACARACTCPSPIHVPLSSHQAGKQTLQPRRSMHLCRAWVHCKKRHVPSLCPHANLAFAGYTCSANPSGPYLRMQQHPSHKHACPSQDPRFLPKRHWQLCPSLPWQSTAWLLCY